MELNLQLGEKIAELEDRLNTLQAEYYDSDNVHMERDIVLGRIRELDQVLNYLRGLRTIDTLEHEG